MSASWISNWNTHTAKTWLKICKLRCLRLYLNFVMASELWRTSCWNSHLYIFYTILWKPIQFSPIVESHKSVLSMLNEPVAAKPQLLWPVRCERYALQREWRNRAKTGCLLGHGIRGRRKIHRVETYCTNNRRKWSIIL